MTWTPFTLDTEEDNDEQELERVSQRMADLAKQMKLFDSEDYTWFQTYLENFKEQVKSDAIALDDPIKHAEKRAEYRLLSHLIALPHRTSLEYQSLRDHLETLGPDTGTPS